ncbi:hypothetical protein FHS14_006427 [Paenibacillus baekrokdamisoli]|nr:hypothetical protein [Paenibacillus baekrokdamisoli]
MKSWPLPTLMTFKTIHVLKSLSLDWGPIK